MRSKLSKLFLPALFLVIFSVGLPQFANSQAKSDPTAHNQKSKKVKREDGSAPLFLPAFWAYSSGYGFGSFAVGELNGDGIPDFVFAGPEYFYCVLGVSFGNGDGTFPPPTCYQTSSGGPLNTTGLLAAVSIADMNGDGKPDIVAFGSCDGPNNCATGNIAVMLNQGDGTFQSAISNTAGLPGLCFGPSAVADVNADGKPDAVTTCNGQVLVLLGNGDGTLQAPSFYDPPYADPPGPVTSNMGGGILTALSVADVNGDGFPDVVLLSWCSAGDDCSSGAVGFLLNNGDGTFQSSSSQAFLENAFKTNEYLSNGMVVADLNGDGIPDIAVVSGSYYGGSGDGAVSVLLGLGGGLYPNPIFGTPSTFDSDGTVAKSIASADINGDGKADLVVLNESCPVPTVCSDSSSVAAFLGNGDGTFQPPQDNTSGNFGGSPLILTDLNGDGIPDVLANANEAFVLLGTLGDITPSTVALSSSLNPVQFGQVVTFTATVTNKTPAPVAGTVTFLDGAAPLATVTLNSGTASFTTDTLPAGAQSITANYNGNASFSTSTSSPLSQIVNSIGGNTPSKVALISSLNPADQGKSITFTAAVSPQSGTGTPTGKVTFQSGTTALSTVTLNHGSATYKTSTLPAGTSVISAIYTGDPTFAGSFSSGINELVVATTTTTLTSSPNPSAIDQQVTFYASVNSSIGAPPNGESVTFKQGSTVLGTGTLSNSSASFTTSTLNKGTDKITATYSGDSNFLASTSESLSQVVGLAATTTDLSSSQNPSSYQQPVTFTATVLDQSGSGTPTGSVTFYNGTKTLGTVTLSNGTATYATSTLAVGTASITAKYKGSSSFSASTSGVLSQTVGLAATSTTLTSSLNPSNSGQDVTFTATLAGEFAGNVTGSVTFTDGSKTLKKVTLSGGTAEYTTTTLTVGGHDITATYDGSTDYSGSSASLTQTVNE